METSSEVGGAEAKKHAILAQRGGRADARLPVIPRDLARARV